MDAVTNPYTPNAGAAPSVMSGRLDQLESFELLLKRLARGRTEQSMIVTGLRGVGKTVLLGEFRRTALEADWVAVEIEARRADELGFRRTMASQLRTALLELSPRARWGERAKSAARVLTSFALTVDPSGAISASLQAEPAEGRGDHQDLGLDLTDLLVSVGEAAAETERGVVLLFDEIQVTRDQLEALIAAMHKTVQRSLPVTLVGAGLPQIAELAGDAKSYAERLFKFPEIGNLSPDDAAEAFKVPAYEEGALWSNEGLALAVQVTEGYPYFIQELGHSVWPLASENRIGLRDVENALPRYVSKLDSSFFRVRLDRCTELQAAYLRAMAELGGAPQMAGAVAEVLNRTSPQCAPTRAELIGMGLLYTPDHGYAAFTVPQFDQYMLRAIPELEVPPMRPRRARS